jgi:hypothetical protein
MDDLREEREAKEFVFSISPFKSTASGEDSEVQQVGTIDLS